MPETFTIPANGTFRTGFPAAHLFVEELSVTDARFLIEGTVVMQNGEEHTFQEEMKKGSRLQFPGVVYKWLFKNESAAPLTVTLKAGLVFYDEQRLVGNIDSRTVNSYDDDRAAAGNAFQGNLRLCGDTTGPFFGNDYGFGQMWNPVGSGVNLYIDSAIASTSSEYLEGGGDTAAPWYEIVCCRTYVEEAENNQVPLAPANRISSGPASVIVKHGGGYSQPTVPYAALERLGFVILSTCIPGTTKNYNEHIVFKNPPIIRPGEGFSAYMGGYSAANKVGATRLVMSWREEPVN